MAAAPPPSPSAPPPSPSAPPPSPSAPPRKKDTFLAGFDEVLEQAQWGDVLFFKCIHRHTAVIRAVTDCPWDHVGVVALNESNELVMLEACVLGVRAFPLKRRVHEYRRYFTHAIGWRRLLAQRTEAGAAACRAFVAAVHGKSYSYNLFKILFTPRRAGGRDPGAARASGIASAYYCSELVCALWQHCAIMQRACHAASFWPVDLANGGACERWLADGCGLAPEIVLSTAVVPPPPPKWRPRPSQIVVSGRAAEQLAAAQQEAAAAAEALASGQGNPPPLSKSWSSTRASHEEKCDVRI